MTVLLVLFTLILFIATDSMVQRVRRARVARALEPIKVGNPNQIPQGVAFALNHTWMREEKKGVTTIGIDGFLSSLAGAVESVLLPPVEARVVLTTPSIALRHKGRELHLTLPIQGAILEVNDAVMKNPALASSDPYGRGWLVRVRPFDRPGPKVTTMVGEDAIRWLREQTDRAKDFLVARLPQPLLLQDGGLPVEGLLKEFSPEVWKEFQATFVTNHIEQ
jgi:glycine cleavage system H protein